MILPQHISELMGSAISADFAEFNGVHSIETEEAMREILNRPTRPIPPPVALVYPYPDFQNPQKIVGYSVKPDAPRLDDTGHAIKYERPDASVNCLYMPKELDRARLCDPSEPLIITEGEKKTLCLLALKKVAVGISGVNGWQAKYDDNKSQPLAEFRDIPLKNRVVFLLFDSDVQTIAAIEAAESGLAKFLISQDAEVRNVRL